MFMIIRKNKILTLFLVALFVSFYADATLFSHEHVIDGATIIHSHIHTDSHHHTKSGGHTQRTITLIAQMSHFDCIDFTCNAILKPIQQPLYKNKIVETTHWLSSIYLQNISLRAPPIV